MAILQLGNQPVVVGGGDGQPFVLYNRDLVNSILIGFGPEIGGGAGANPNQYNILDPLGNIAFDGTDVVWGSTLVANATANIDCIESATNVGTSPVLAAEQISLAGIFQVVKESVVTMQASQPIAASTTITLGPWSVTQSGYEIAFEFQAGSTSAAMPFVSVDMQWSSSVTGQRVARERWFPSQGSGSEQFFYGTGPTKGDTLQIQITNQSTTGLTMGFFNLTQSSRTYARDDWRQDTQATVPGFTSGTYEQAGGILMSTAPTVGATSSTKRIMPLYSGLIGISFVPPSGIASPGARFVVNNEGAANTSSALAALTVAQTNDSVNSQIDQIYLPRAICSVTIFNDSSASGTFSWTAYIAETPQ
jgi:hypothetical protein